MARTTALVNQGYVRLVDGTVVEWQDRAHFLVVAARIMRCILVDHPAHEACESAAEASHARFDEALVVTAAARGELIRATAPERTPSCAFVTVPMSALSVPGRR